MTHPLHLTIDTHAEFGVAVRATLDAALARDTRSVLWVDPDFARWPLDDPGLIDALTAWLRRPQRRLMLLAADFERVAREHPRFAQWRTPWLHAIEARTPSDLPRVDLPTLMLDDGPTVLELWDRDPPRGRAAHDPAAARAARDRVDASWQRGTPAWPAKPLGL